MSESSSKAYYTMQCICELTSNVDPNYCTACCGGSDLWKSLTNSADRQCGRKSSPQTSMHLEEMKRAIAEEGMASFLTDSPEELH
jgi:hypothetical protein